MHTYFFSQSCRRPRFPAICTQDRHPQDRPGSTQLHGVDCERDAELLRHRLQLQDRHDLLVRRDDSEDIQVTAAPPQLFSGLSNYEENCRSFFRAPIDEGHKKEVVIDHNIVTADGLAVDWIYSHLYWTDTGTNSICMSDLDGNLITTIITDQLEEPRAIALHPAKGYFQAIMLQLVAFCFKKSAF